jgi:hypothetical protein
MKNRPKHRYPLNVRPEHFPIGSVESRTAARQLLEENQKRVQMIFTCPEEPLDLIASECFRSRCPDGTILELIYFHGNGDELSEGEHEEFVLRHPILLAQ